MYKITLGLVQTSCGPDIEQNMHKTFGFIKDAAVNGAQIVCLQELYRTEYFCQSQNYQHFTLAETIPGPTTAALSAMARENEIVIIAPIFEKYTDGIYFNSAAVLDADGSLAGIYRKMHIPQDPGFEEKFYFTPGDLGFKTIKTKYASVGTLICWDQWYPEAARLTAMKGAQILFYPTAIGWDSTEPRHVQNGQLDAWRTIQRAHAIANGCYVCAVNRVGKEGKITFWGNSFVADPLGRLLHVSGDSQEGCSLVQIALDDIDFYRTHWPFFRDRRTDAYSEITQRFGSV